MSEKVTDSVIRQETSPDVRMTSCPSCNGKLSMLAATCPHCGEVVDTTKAVTQNVAHLLRPYGAVAIVLMSIGALSLICGFSAKHQPAVVLGALSFAVGLLAFRSRRLICVRCGTKANPLAKGANVVIALLLFFLGVVPGIIYWLLYPTHYYCRNCGQEALD